MSPVREGVVVIGRRHEPEDHRLRDFLTRTAQPHEWVEAGTPEAGALLDRHALATADLPVVLSGSTAVRGATVEQLVLAWELSATPTQARYDLAIIGAGPAGLAAAVYAASDGLSTVVLEREVPGGQASHTSLIENFFGFPGGIGGAELARLAGRQAEGFGAELAFLQPVVASRQELGRPVELELERGDRVCADVVIAAPGMVWRRLEVDGVEDLLGRGVYYGAGRSEARHCGDDDVVVVGAGNSAGQAVMDLGNAGARVRMVVRGPGLGATMSQYLVDRIADHPLIDVQVRTEVVAVRADDDGSFGGLTLRGPEGGLTEIPARALFLCIGGTPRTGWAVEHGIPTDPAGYLLTGPDLLVDGRRPDGWPLDRDPLHLETGVPGLFAAGDVRHGSTKRVAGAVGDGAGAVALAHRRLAEIRDA